MQKKHQPGCPCCGGLTCDNCFSAAPTNFRITITEWPLEPTDVPNKVNICACPSPIVGNYDHALAWNAVTQRYEGTLSVLLGACDGKDWYIRTSVYVVCCQPLGVDPIWKACAKFSIEEDAGPPFGTHVQKTFGVVSNTATTCPGYTGLRTCPVTWPYTESPAPVCDSFSLFGLLPMCQPLLTAGIPTTNIVGDITVS